MKVMKRLFSIAFILVLVISLTACGSSPSTNGTGTNKDSSKSNTTDATNTTNTTKTTQDKSTKKSASTPTKSAPKMDLHGRTITIAHWDNQAPDDKTVRGRLLLAQQKKVEQDYNVKIKYLTTGWGKNNDKLIASVLAGKPYADLVRETVSEALPDIAKNLILPVSSYAPDMSKYSKYFKPALQFKNQSYGVNDVTDGDASGIYYNLDIMKKYNLPDPQKLAKEGKWTWSEFEKVAKQATIDTNNDGKTDVWGLAGWDIDAWQFFPETDNALMVDGNGNVNLTNPKMIESLEFYQKLINTDHVWEVQPKSDPDQFQERKTFGMGHAFMTPTFDWAIAGFKNINFGFVPFPVGPHGKGFIGVSSDPNGWVIPKGTKNPEAVMEIFYALRDIKQIDDYPNQTLYEREFKRQSDLNYAKQVFQHQGTLHEGDYNNFPLGDILKDILLKHENVTSVLKKYQPKAKSIVDKILNPQ